MSVPLWPRKASLALTGVLALGLACPSFADMDFNAFTSSRIEVRILDASGNAIQPGPLKVYRSGKMVDAAQPGADGSYVLGKESRGVLKLVFSDIQALGSLAGFTPADTMEGGAYLVANLGPKFDFYASMMGVTPRVTLTVGEKDFKPDFPIDWNVLGGRDTTHSADRAASSSRSDLRRLPGDVDRTVPPPMPMAPGGFTCATATPLVLGVTASDVLPGGWPGADPCAQFVPGAGKYWTFTPTAAQEFISMRTDGPDAASFALDTTMSVFSGSCGAPVCVAYSDDANGNFTSKVDFCATPGTQYWVEVTNWFGGGAGLPFDLISSTPPVPPLGGGPTCAAAVPLVNNVPIEGSTFNCDSAGAGAGTPVCSLPYGAFYQSGSGAWFSYHSSSTAQKIRVTTAFADKPNYDSTLRVYCASCPVTTCVASDDDSGNSISIFTSDLTFNAQPDADYVILLEGSTKVGWQLGDFRILLTESGGQGPMIHPADVPSPRGPNLGDGQANSVNCNPVGATCIKCLDDANCFEDLDRTVAAQIGGTYLGDDTKCISKQGAPVTTVTRTPNIPYASTIDVTDFMNVVSTDNISKLTVHLDMPCQWIADQMVDLTHLDTGTTTPLWRTSGCTNPNLLITFDEDFPDIYWCVDASIDGSFGPADFWASDLVRFNGQAAAGTWALRYRDVFVGFGGTFRSWALNFDTRVVVPNCGPANNGLGNGVDAQPGQSDNCNDCPK